MLERVFSRLNPSDVFEEIYAKDFVDLTWEALRYRRYKAYLIESAVSKALEEALGPIVNHMIETWGSESQKSEIRAGLTPSPTEKLVGAWISRDSETIKSVEKMLKSADLTMENINARAMRLVTDILLDVNRLLTQAEVSRIAAMSEFESWRLSFAVKLRQATQHAIDAEFEEVGPEDGTDQSKAA